MERLGGRFGVLCLEEEVEVASGSGLLELDVAAEEVVDADGLVDWERRRCGRVELDLQQGVSGMHVHAPPQIPTSSSADRPRRAMTLRTTRSGFTGRLSRSI